MDLASKKTNPLLTRLPKIYYRLLQSLSSKQGMPNSIGDIARLSKVLHGFNPARVCASYGLDWKELFNIVRSEIRPASRMDIKIPQNFWVVFTKGSVDAAFFLSKFKSGNDFVESVRLFAENEILAPAMPMLLSLEIRGIGFALACDFLKEAGWSQYAKPDVHTKRILQDVGFADGEDYGTYKAMLTIARHTNQTPYAVDKVLWLIGSGRLYNVGKRFKTSREEFIGWYNTIYGE